MAGTTEVKIAEFLRSLANPVEALSLKHLLLFDFKSRQAQRQPQDLALVTIALDLNNFLRQNYVGNFESEEILRDFQEFVDDEQKSSEAFCTLLDEYEPIIYENSISKKFERLFPGGFCLRDGETAIIQAFSSIQDHLNYVSIRLMVAAAVEKCFGLSDGEGELKQQNNYFQKKIKKAAKIIGIDKDDQNRIISQVRNLDAEMARISKEVTSKLEEKERQHIEDLGRFQEDLADVTEIIPPPPRENEESGFFQDIPDLEESSEEENINEGGDGDDNDDDDKGGDNGNGSGPSLDVDGCPTIYSPEFNKKRRSFELEDSPHQKDLLLLSNSSSDASPIPNSSWISLSPSPPPSKSSEFLTPPTLDSSTTISTPPSWCLGKNDHGTPTTPEGYRSPNHPSPPPRSPTSPSTIQISSNDSSPKVLFEGIPDIPTFPNPRPKLPEKECDWSDDDSWDSAKIMKIIFKDRKNLNPTVASVSVVQEVVEDPFDKIRSSITSTSALATPTRPEENKIENTIQKVFIQNNNNEALPTPPIAPPLATYLIGTGLENAKRFTDSEDPLAISITDELVELSSAFGNNLFQSSNRPRLPKRSSSFRGVYTESPLERPLSPRPSTSGTPTTPNVVKKQKKSQDLDPDFDPNSRVKGKASRRAPAKSSKNRKYKKQKEN